MGFFAVHNFGTPLVVVLGHSQCGAVQTALRELKTPSANLTPGLKSLLERVQPPVESVMAQNPPADEADLVAAAVKANVLAGVETLRRESDLLRKYEQETGLLILGAEYSLETGKVEFFEYSVKES